MRRPIPCNESCASKVDHPTKYHLACQLPCTPDWFPGYLWAFLWPLPFDLEYRWASPHTNKQYSLAWQASLNKANIHSVATGDIYEVYCDISVELGLSPLTQRRLSGLINELDAIGLLNSRIVSMGRYGRTKKIRLGIGRSLLREAFSSDCRFQNIQHYVPKLARPK